MHVYGNIRITVDININNTRVKRINKRKKRGKLYDFILILDKMENPKKKKLENCIYELLNRKPKSYYIIPTNTREQNAFTEFV